MRGQLPSDDIREGVFHGGHLYQRGSFEAIFEVPDELPTFRLCRDQLRSLLEPRFAITVLSAVPLIAFKTPRSLVTRMCVADTASGNGPDASLFAGRVSWSIPLILFPMQISSLYRSY